MQNSCIFVLVLKAVETVGLRHIKESEDYRNELEKVLRGYPGGVARAVCRVKCDSADVRKDHISHFILRLAYCRMEELRRWFIAQELDLFRFRFQNENKDNIKLFLEKNNLNYDLVSIADKEDHRSELVACGTLGHLIEFLDFYKVEFYDVLDLVQRRRVHVTHGFAYVPYKELVTLVLSEFRSQLSHALTIASRALPNLEEDNRLLPMLSSMSKSYLGQDYGKKTSAGQITADMIDLLSRTSFPMCMQELHQSLRQHHHLRHWGRQQYGLFLKGIGLTLEEALKFWRSEFTKLMDGDKFDKQYTYNIRHNYGKEGKRADYTPYSCVKVITTNAPAAGDYHGCPFRHVDIGILRQKLQAKRIPESGINEIVSLVKGSHYQVACGKYFMLTHNSGHDFSPNHPNEYFDESQKLLHGGKDAGTPSGGVKLSQAKPSSQSTASQKSSSHNAVQDDDDLDNLTLDEIDQSMNGIEV
ncbi:DNA primase large subunit [Lamellibrachia satsuma]|nr:DNA primase large subunit [Lamellibrachia satsuma]